METLGHELITRVLGRSVDPDSLVGSIAAWIAGAIIEDRLRPGDDLNSVDLAKQFATSRTPVREALLILEKEGLVTILPRHRPYVAHISLKEVREIYQVRAHLVMLAAELIVNTASDEAIASLKAALSPIRELPVEVALTRIMVLRSLAIIEQSGWTGFQTKKEGEEVA